MSSTAATWPTRWRRSINAYNRDCLIVADLSNDATYAETLVDTFGPRVVGLQIGRSGDGTTCEQRTVRTGRDTGL